MRRLLPALVLIVLAPLKLRGLEKVDWLFVFSCAAHNLIRLPKLKGLLSARLVEQCA